MSKLFSHAVRAACLTSCNLIQRQVGLPELGPYLLQVFEPAVAASDGITRTHIKALGRWLERDYHDTLMAHSPSALAALIQLVADPESAKIDQAVRRPICCRTKSMVAVLPNFFEAAGRLHAAGKLSLGDYCQAIFQALIEAKSLHQSKTVLMPPFQALLPMVADRNDPIELDKLRVAWELIERKPFPVTVPCCERDYNCDGDCDRHPARQAEPEPDPDPPAVTAFLDSPTEDEFEFLDKNVDESGIEGDESLDEAETFETYRHLLDFDSPAPMAVFNHSKHGWILLMCSVMGEVYVDSTGAPVEEGRGVEQVIYKGGAFYDRDSDKEVTHKNLDEGHGMLVGPLWYTDSNGTLHILKGFRPPNGLGGLIGKFWTNAKRTCPKCQERRPHNFYDPKKWLLEDGLCLKCQRRRVPPRENGDIEELKRWFIIRKRDDQYLLDIFDNENRYTRFRNTIRRRVRGEQQQERQEQTKPTTKLPVFVGHTAPSKKRSKAAPALH